MLDTEAKEEECQVAPQDVREIDQIWYGRTVFVLLTSLQLLIALPKSSSVIALAANSAGLFGYTVVLLFAAAMIVCGCVLVGSAWPRVERRFLTVAITALTLIIATSVL